MSISSHAHRNAVIVANAYALPSYVTPDIEARLGADMVARARRERHFARMPSSPAAKIISGAMAGGKASVARRMSPATAAGIASAQARRSSATHDAILRVLADHCTAVAIAGAIGHTERYTRAVLHGMAAEGAVTLTVVGKTHIWHRATDTGMGA